MSDNPHLVSTEWLAAHLAAPDLVVVDGSWYLPTQKRSGRDEYAAGHIPGAVYLDIDEVSDPVSGLPHMLPKPEDFARHMSLLGIGHHPFILPVSDKKPKFIIGGTPISAMGFWCAALSSGPRASFCACRVRPALLRP
jgi:3-mercaptopyruvate sulfurtransferase SseA